MTECSMTYNADNQLLTWKASAAAAAQDVVQDDDGNTTAKKKMPGIQCLPRPTFLLPSAP